MVLVTAAMPFREVSPLESAQEKPKEKDPEQTETDGGRDHPAPRTCQVRGKVIAGKDKADMNRGNHNPGETGKRS